MTVPRPLSTSLCALALTLLCVLPSKAEFPPEGAVPDARNPALATGDYPDATQSDTKAHYVLYFDCPKRMWIGVAITASGGTATSSPHGREFPSGPPIGARRDASDPNHATNNLTHQMFAFSNGVWIDVKSRQVARSAKLCPDSVAPAARQPESEPPAPVIEEKPDRLPPSPTIKADGNSRS